MEIRKSFNLRVLIGVNENFTYQLSLINLINWYL